MAQKLIYSLQPHNIFINGRFCCLLEPVSWPGPFMAAAASRRGSRWVCTSQTLIDGFRSPSSRRFLGPFMNAIHFTLRSLPVNSNFTAFTTLSYSYQISDQAIVFVSRLLSHVSQCRNRLRLNNQNIADWICSRGLSQWAGTSNVLRWVHLEEIFVAKPMQRSAPQSQAHPPPQGSVLLTTIASLEEGLDQAMMIIQKLLWRDGVGKGVTEVVVFPLFFGIVFCSSIMI